MELVDNSLVIAAVCKATGNGVEMEALTAASVAATSDMCKGLDKGMVISQTRLLEKTGGDPAVGVQGDALLINLLFFGRLGDLAKGIPTTIEANTPTEIRQLLAADHPKLAAELFQPQVLVSVNQAIADWDQQLSDGSEVTFLPPVTGG